MNNIEINSFTDGLSRNSKIVLINSNLNHDKGYESSFGFLTSDYYNDGKYGVYAYNKRTDRWWECMFSRIEFRDTECTLGDFIDIIYRKELEEKIFRISHPILAKLDDARIGIARKILGL